MADYYPLLARALDALPDRTPALRKAVYERARNALIGQLRSLEPPLSDDDIDLERRALDAAIGRLEVEHGGVPAPANDPAQAGAAAAQGRSETAPTARPEPPAPAPPPPAAQPAAAQPAAAQPPTVQLPPDAVPPNEPPEAEPRPASTPLVLPPAPPPVFASGEPKAPREASIAIVPPKARPAAEGSGDAVPVEVGPQGTPEEPSREAEAPREPDLPSAATAPEAAEAANGPEAGNGRVRPRIAVVPPRPGRSRALRNAFVGTVLALVIGLIAVAAFLLRDKPQTLASGGTETAETQQTDAGEAKFGDRVGGEAAPAERGAQRPDGAARKGEAAPGGAAASGVAVAQRAVLIEEGAGGENAPPVTSTGRATWKLDTVNGEQGQPLQTAVVATVTFPDPGLTLVMTIQRNLDATLPASHTVTLAFTETGADAAARTVQDIGLLQAKDDEAARGSPLSGLPVRVSDNLFLIGLSSLRNDVDRNTDLLLHRNWFDLGVKYSSGKRAVLTFEKGNAGAQVMQSAFDAWR